MCEMRGGRIAEARAATVAGTAIDAASDDLWRLRFGLELDMEDHAAATATVVAMSQGRGAALNGIELRWLYQLSRKLREAEVLLSQDKTVSEGVRQLGVSEQTYYR